MKLNTNIVDYILSNYNQESIYSKLLQIPIDEIKNSIKYKYNIINTLRGEDKPSLSLRYREAKLKMWDYGNPLYRGDIFDLIGIVLNKNVNNKKDFIIICNYIIANFKRGQITSPVKSIPNYTIIDYIDKIIYGNSLKYWTDVYVTKQHLINRGVHAASKVYISNDLQPSSRNLFCSDDNNNLIFIYVENFTNRLICKVYQPYGSKDNKFRTNNKLPLEGITDLYSSNILIITKSKKDKLVLESILDKGTIVRQLNNLIIKQSIPFNTYPFVEGFYNKFFSIDSNYCIISVNSESVLLHPNLVKYLYSKHNTIIINYDYDLTGIFNSYFYYKVYNFIPVFFGKPYDSILNLLTDQLIKLLKSKFLEFNMDFNVKDFINFIKFHADSIIGKDIYEITITDKNIIYDKFNQAISQINKKR